MRVVFADTGYWVALLNPRNDLHNKAINLSKALQPAHIVTSEMVLTEVLNDFSSFFKKIYIILLIFQVKI